MLGFRFVGAFLLLLALVLSAYGISSLVDRPVPPIPRPGIGFSGNLKIPQTTVDAAFSQAASRAAALNREGRTLTGWGSLGTVGSFLCTSAITLILGFFGRSGSPVGQQPDTTGLGLKWARTVGFLAAAAAVLTGAGALLKDHGTARYEASDKAASSIARARADIAAATTANEQTAVLHELQRQIDGL